MHVPDGFLDAKTLALTGAYWRGKGIRYTAGQFMEVSVFGRGEAPISISSGSGQRVSPDCT